MKLLLPVQKHYADLKRIDHSLELMIQIIRSIGKNCFALNLPSNWKINYNFHVSKQRLANQNDNAKYPSRETQPPPDPIIKLMKKMKTDMKWKRLQIIAEREIEYRVRLQGFNPKEDTWETTNTLSKTRELIREYYDSIDIHQINYIHIKRSKHNKCKLIQNPDRIDTSQQCETITGKGQRCK